MTSERPLSADSEAAIRVPKLAVRNRTSISTTNSGSSNGSDARPASRSNASTSTGTVTSQRPRSTTNASIASDTSKATQQTQSKKKKGVLGFLTLKEPSTLAFEQYAEQQRKAAAEKGGRSTAVGMQGVAKQKLPDYVPKVNSKWDGLPEEARRKIEQQRRREKRSTDSGSYFSGQSYRSNNSSSDGTLSPGQRIGTLSSRPQSLGTPPRSRNGSVHSSRIEVVSTKPSLEYWRSAPTAFHPGVRPQSAHKETAAVPQSFLYPPSPPTGVVELPADDVQITELDAAENFELAGDDRTHAHELIGDRPAVPELANYDGVAYVTTPHDQSPLTPPVQVHELPAYVPRSLEKEPVELEAPGTVWYSDTDTEETAVNSPVAQALFPPGIVQRQRSRPAMEDIAEDDSEDAEDRDKVDGNWPLRPGESGGRPSPTGHSSRTSSATGYTCDMMESQQENREPDVLRHSVATSIINSYSHRPGTAATMRDERPMSPARSGSDSSIAASVAPSVMSAQWNMTPKERLGLGSRVRKSEVLPWEQQEPASTLDSTVANRNSGMSSSSGRKRISAMLGRK